jgi:hypothetical protein
MVSDGTLEAQPVGFTVTVLVQAADLETAQRVYVELITMVEERGLSRHIGIYRGESHPLPAAPDS